MLKALESPNIVVQGASRGIGSALLELIIAQYPQATIIATCRDAGNNSLTQSEQVTWVPLDLTSNESLTSGATKIKAHLDKVNLLINVAGLLHDTRNNIRPEKRLVELDFESCTSVFHTNCIGPSALLAKLLPLFPKNECAIVANVTARVGSISDNRLGGWYSYRASKAAMNMVTKTLSIEMARDRKQAAVVSLHPGTTDTNLSKPFQKNVPEDKLFSSERCAKQLLEIIEGLTMKDNGRFIAWDGSDITW